jgi:hypothetical protein
MITIPKPCSENWSKMSKTDKGRFCESCHHEVVDFRKMSNDKIEDYFEKNQSKSICGNFKSAQIVADSKEWSLKNWILKLNFKPLNYALFLMSFLVSSCFNVTGKPALEDVESNTKIDSISKQPNKEMLGAPIYVSPKDSIKEKSSNEK